MSDAGRPVRFETEELLAHADWARELAVHLVRDASDADDLVQDALSAAVRRPPLADRPLRPWLAAVLRKLALARRRGEGRRERRERDAATPAARAEAPSAAEVAARLDVHRLLAEMVADLAEPLRATVYLRYYEGLDSNEIGLRMGVPATTVRGRLARAVADLRARLDARSKGGRGEWLAALAPVAVPSIPRVTRVPVRAPGAALIAGALAMATTTKILLGAAAAVALVALVWRSDALHPQRAPATATLVAEDAPLAAPADRRDPPTRAARPGAADPAAAPAAPDAAAAGNAEDALPDRGRFVVRARVLDAAGTPAAGARVQPGTASASPGADADAAGRVEFPVEGVAADLEFVVSAHACATRVVAAPPLRSAGVIDLGDVRLSAGGAVTGRVVEGDVPVAAVRIGVAVRGEDAFVLVDDPQCDSDVDGRFTLRGVPVGTQQISFGKPRFESSVVTVDVRAGEERAAGIVRMQRLDPSVRVCGIVLTPDGAPAAGVTLSYRCEGGGGTSTGSLPSDAQGRFDIQGGKDKAWQLVARDASGRSSDVVQVASGAAAVELRLVETPWVELVVTRSDGAPVERFDVRLWGTTGVHVGSFPVDAPEGGAGRIRMPAHPFILSVTAPGCETANAGPFDPSKAGPRIEIRATPLPGIRGRVTAGGAPVAGAHVTLRDVIRPGTREIRNGFACVTSPSEQPGADTDADGSFQITLRKAGRFVLRADAPGLAAAEAGPFDLAPDAGRQGIVIAMTAGGGIEGRVLPAAGQGVDGVIVGVSRGDGEARTTRTGPDGAFRFDLLTPGPWLVRRVEREIRPGHTTVLSTDGEARFDWSCKVDEGAVTHFDLDLSVEPKSVVRGEIRVDGAPAAGWRAHLQEGAGVLTGEEVATAKVEETGAFRLVAPRAGDYLVRASSPRRLMVFAPVTIGDAETTFDFDVATGAASVRGGAPREPLALLWEDARGRAAVAFLEIDASGACAATQFLAGRVRLVRPGVDEPDPRRWTPVAEGVLAAGGTITLDVPAK